LRTHLYVTTQWYNIFIRYLKSFENRSPLFASIYNLLTLFFRRSMQLVADPCGNATFIVLQINRDFLNQGFTYHKKFTKCWFCLTCHPYGFLGNLPMAYKGYIRGYNWWLSKLKFNKNLFITRVNCNIQERKWEEYWVV